MGLYQFVPLIGSALLVAIAFVWRPWLHRRRYGSSGLTLFRSAGQRPRDIAAIVLFGFLLGQGVVYGLQAGARSPTSDLARALGAALLFLGLVLMVVSQLDLGASWRIGIDEATQPGLVTGGLYRYCRNPIYVGLLAVITGYALFLPTQLSLVLLGAAWIGVRLQVAAEESYLLRTYGDAYREYAARVGRFMPWLGRL